MSVPMPPAASDTKGKIISKGTGPDARTGGTVPPRLPGRLALPVPEATRAAGRRAGKALLELGLAKFLITLEGPLGAGKTTFCQGLAEGAGVPPGLAASPTFSLCHQYPAAAALFHLDLYRLGPDAAAEFEGAGLEECLDRLCLVEWPDRLAGSYWPPERLELYFINPGRGRVLEAAGDDPAALAIWTRTLGAKAGL
ncbi:MAG: tRNA (adenosine(37)-N6)-threonylcarbamoyltransferase complex ATPase subunit type 1 TsaE [Deltaproteobacteria bacterium]|nr:tRNA (adenosine(37)-N6)-threonylcarbamoyltransferase complex ATPase subunit type 1 TsaE [Deltaproteobacteria bacterium]